MKDQLISMLYNYKSIKFLIFDRNVTFHNKTKNFIN